MRIINKDEIEIYKTIYSVSCDFCNCSSTKLMLDGKEPRIFFGKKDGFRKNLYLKPWYSGQTKDFGEVVDDANICEKCVRELFKKLNKKRKIK